MTSPTQSPIVLHTTRRRVRAYCLLAAAAFAAVFAFSQQQASALFFDQDAGPKVFQEVYGQVVKHYVDEPDQSQLLSGALAGMEEVLKNDNKVVPSFPIPDLKSQDLKGNEARALEVAGAAFKHYLNASNVEPSLLEVAAIKGMLKTLDPHSAFMTPAMYKEIQVETRGEFGGVGIQIGIKNDRLAVIAPIEGTPAERAGIRPGDFIVKVNDEPTKGMTLLDAVQRMRGTRGTRVSLTIEREGTPGPLNFTLVREIIRIESVKSKVIENNIAYIRLIQFQESTPKDLRRVLQAHREQRTQATILDLRNNPGGLLTSAVEVSEQFVGASKLIVSIKGRDGRKDEYVSRSKEPDENTPMIVLVNEGSASASEIVAGTLRDWGRAVVIGAQTFGKGSVQTIVPLSDGSALRLSTARYYLPKGSSVDAKIQPDAVVEEKEGQDIPLMAAKAALTQSLAYGSRSGAKLLELARQASVGPSTASAASSRPLAGSQVAVLPSDVDKVPSLKPNPKPNAYAVVFGIETYREKLPKADFAAGDAKLMGEYLTKVLGYPEENVVVRLNEKAARSDIEKYFEEWLPNNVEPGGSVFIYYSGHGAPNPKTGDAYLVPYDGDPTFVGTTAYPLKRLYAALDKLPAKDIVVVLDSCFSGGGGRSVLAKGARPMGIALEGALASTGKAVVLAASSGDQISSTYEEKGHGLMTYFFLKGLQGEGDLNKDGVIELTELYNYVRPNVQRIARKQYNTEQIPQLLASPDVLRKGAGRLIEAHSP